MDCTMLSALDNNPAFDDWLRRLAAPDGQTGNPSPSPSESAPSTIYTPVEQQQQQQAPLRGQLEQEILCSFVFLFLTRADHDYQVVVYSALRAGPLQ